MIKTLFFTLVATAAIAKADISPSTIAHFKEWAKAHRTNFIQSYTYRASRLVDEVPGPVSPGCSLFAPLARNQYPQTLLVLAPFPSDLDCMGRA